MAESSPFLYRLCIFAGVVEVVDDGPCFAAVCGLLLKLPDVIGIYVEESEALLDRFALGTGVVTRETERAILVDAFVILLPAA
jgi:hypothetical protein